MTNQQRVIKFRLWRSLVKMSPKAFRIRFVERFDGIHTVLEEWIFSHRHDQVGSYSSGARVWDWSVIDRLPAWPTK